jgi:hypothetical protein
MSRPVKAHLRNDPTTRSPSEIRARAQRQTERRARAHTHTHTHTHTHACIYTQTNYPCHVAKRCHVERRDQQDNKRDENRKGNRFFERIDRYIKINAQHEEEEHDAKRTDGLLKWKNEGVRTQLC